MNLLSIVAGMSGKSLLQIGSISEIEVKVFGFEPTTT